MGTAGSQSACQLAVGDVSRALVQIFFATTALKKDSGAGADVQPRLVRSLGVLGAGFMGSGIGGTAVSQAEVDVRFRDTGLAAVGKGVVAARRILDDSLKRKRITRYEHRRLTALVSGGTDWAGFGRADLVIEAVFEDLQAKHQVFRDLEAVVREDCLLASNTSTIPIARIAAALQHPERLLGMHFFSPVEKMQLLEVIVTDRTAPWATATAVDFGRRMGKTVVVVRDEPGFWVNRILAPYLNEAGGLVLEIGEPVLIVEPVARQVQGVHDGEEHHEGRDTAHDHEDDGEGLALRVPEVAEELFVEGLHEKNPIHPRDSEAQRKAKCFLAMDGH